MSAYTRGQIQIIEGALNARVFLSGPAGAGKTTAGVERMLFLMAQGVRADSILLLIPQRTLAEPYTQALRYPGAMAGGVVSVLTVGGLAQRMVDLFWPLVAEPAGFARPDLPPTFLTLETAQYYMSRLVRPLLDEKGYFESITITRNRLYSQIIDNLNKAAVVGFPHTEIAARLKDAWVGESSQARVYDDAQDCANRFRRYCLEHNLLDFSLQMELFRRYAWPQPACRAYLTQTYRHLIVDNLEEDTPVAHDLLDGWLPEFDSALLIYDTEAGYRRFLGTDPQSGFALRQKCDQSIVFEHSLVSSPELENFGAHLGLTLGRKIASPDAALDPYRIRGALVFATQRYFPQMLDWVAGQIGRLIFDEQTPPGQIVVLAPFLPDALRFSLSERLSRLGIASRSHRPSRALREEPAAQCLLTLAALAHPAWGLRPTKFDVAYALIQAIEGLDLVRAQLLTEIVYRIRDGAPTLSELRSLSAFDRIKPETQARITYRLGQRYETLRAWLTDYAADLTVQDEAPEALDIFLSRLFGELLSQPGFGFHHNMVGGEIAANLVESARKFRWGVPSWEAVESAGAPGERPLGERPPGGRLPFEAELRYNLGKEYLELVQDGVVAAQYIQSWQLAPEEAVLLAPAYTFLMRNQPVDYQFWLDVSGRGWFERLYQPLTHPYVLSRQWPAGLTWSDAEEYETNQETLYRLVLGLLRRCRQKIYLGMSELNEQGNDQKGPLLKALQRVLRQTSAPDQPHPFEEEGR